MVAWGCAVWGTGYYYPPYVRLRRRLPDLLPVLSDLRLRRVVQPVDRRVHARRRRPTVRTAAPASARATTRGPAPTRAARRRTGRTARAARRRPTTRAPARTARRGRARTSTAAGDTTGVQRGDQWAHHVARHQQRDRHDDARDAGQRRRRGGHAQRAGRQRRRRADRQRRRLRRPRRQRLHASRATAGRSTTATAAGTTSSSRRPAAARAGASECAEPEVVHGTRRPPSR